MGQIIPPLVPLLIRSHMGRLLLASFAAGQTRERGQVRSSLRSLLGLQLIGESKLGCFLLKLGKFVLILGHLLEGGLDELALHVTDGDGELVDLKITEDDLTLEEEHFSFKGVPFVEVLLADLLELVCGSVVEISFGSTALGNDTETLLSFSLLFLLQLLSCLLAKQGAELLLALRGHESLLLSHFDVLVRIPGFG